jgi:hypothetical protein
MIAFSLIGISTNFSNGFLSRLSEEEQQIYSFKSYDIEFYYRANDCFLSSKQTYDAFKKECLSGKSLIWGDSHAAALSFGLREINDFSQLTASACPPIINQYFPARPLCLDINNRILEYVKDGSFTEIYLHSNWLGYDISQISMLSETIDKILLIDPSINIKIIGGVPQWQPSLPDILLRAGISMSDVKNIHMMKNNEYLKVRELDKEIVHLLHRYKANANIEFISMLDKFCEDESCISLTSDCSFFEPTAWDYGHLTASGSKLAARFILHESDLTASQCSD